MTEEHCWSMLLYVWPIGGPDIKCSGDGDDLGKPVHLETFCVSLGRGRRPEGAYTNIRPSCRQVRHRPLEFIGRSPASTVPAGLWSWNIAGAQRQGATTQRCMNAVCDDLSCPGQLHRRQLLNYLTVRIEWPAPMRRPWLGCERPNGA